MAVLKLLWTMSRSYISSSHVLEYLPQNCFLMVIYHLRCFITHVDFWKSHLPSSVSLSLFFLLYVSLLILSLCLDCSTLESPSRLDEEHRLIARYAARLAAEASNSTVRLNSQSLKLHLSTLQWKEKDPFLLCGIYWKSTACLVIFICVHLAFMLHN